MDSEHTGKLPLITQCAVEPIAGADWLKPVGVEADTLEVGVGVANISRAGNGVTSWQRLGPPV